MVDLSVFVMLYLWTSGLPSGYRSKCGPGLSAPNQCVVSTEMTPSNGAAMSYHRLAKSTICRLQILTTVNVLRFSESDLARIFLVGHNKLNAFPSSRWVMEYTSSAYSGRTPSATSHMPSRNFMITDGSTRTSIEEYHGEDS